MILMFYDAQTNKQPIWFMLTEEEEEEKYSK
jgi:hypothetical protein